MTGPAARVAVVEDEPAQRGAIAAALERAGYAVGAWADGSDVVAIGAFHPDLAILDIRLPGRNGLKLARILRLAGFAAGADDYLVKPVVLEELLARAGAVLRRSGRLPRQVTTVGDVVIDEDATLVTRAGHPIARRHWGRSSAPLVSVPRLDGAPVAAVVSAPS